MTLRQARRRLGSRSRRRSNTNGKCTGQTTSKGRAIKRRNPKPVSRRNIIAVKKLMAGQTV